MLLTALIVVLPVRFSLLRVLIRVSSLLKEKADAIGGAGGKTRSTQQQTLQMDGMRLLIEGISAALCLAVDLGCKGAIGFEGKVGIALAGID